MTGSFLRDFICALVTLAGLLLWSLALWILVA